MVNPENENAVEALLKAVQEKFEGKLGAEEEAWLTYDTAAIYVAARQVESERVKLLSDAVKWRLKRRVTLCSRECAKCVESSQSHDARMFGTDAEGDVVFMNCFALPRDLNASGIADHMACLFERALQRYPVAAPALRRWTWVVDIYGFGFEHTDPRTTIELLDLLSFVYPERLKRMLIVDAPAIFWGLWNVVKPMIQAKTAEKIEFVTWDKAPGRYEECFGEEVARRLSTEGAENRDHAAVKGKRWTTFYAADLVPSQSGETEMRGGD